MKTIPIRTKLSAKLNTGQRSREKPEKLKNNTLEGGRLILKKSKSKKSTTSPKRKRSIKFPTAPPITIHNPILNHVSLLLVLKKNQEVTISAKMESRV